MDIDMDIIKILADSTIVLVPKSCYVIDKSCPGGHEYEIFHNGKKMNNVEGIIINSLIK